MKSKRTLDQRWIEVPTSTIHMADGTTIERPVNGLDLDGMSGYILVDVREIKVVLKDGQWHEYVWKCLLCGKTATHRLAYGAKIRGKLAVCFVCHCEAHASPYDEDLSTLRDVQAITRHALCNAADPLMRQRAKKDLART